MTWNYRIIIDGKTCGIHEVYYDDNGHPKACSEERMAPFGETVLELIADIELMWAAGHLPPLAFDDKEGKLVEILSPPGGGK